MCIRDRVNTEREVLKKHYDRLGENGFDYAYRFPGMNKVLQAAGRVIRTKEDVGCILLMDERFRSTEYRILFPEEWNDMHICRMGNVESILKDVYKRQSQCTESMDAAGRADIKERR